MKPIIVLLIAISAAALGGCPADQPAATVEIDLSIPSTLDGTWRITSPGASGADCVTIQNGNIVRRDGGCDGSEDEIAAAAEPSISGDRVVWSFAAVISGANVPFTLDVRVQAGGTLSGTISVIDIDAGGVNASGVLMTRQ